MVSYWWVLLLIRLVKGRFIEFYSDGFTTAETVTTSNGVDYFSVTVYPDV